MKTTIAQQLKIKYFPFVINDKDGNRIYWENSDGFWYKNEYDEHGQEIDWEASNGYWRKNEYDANGNQISWEDSDGYWNKREYDEHGQEIYYEDSDGRVIDKRLKVIELTLQQIADKMGIKVEQLRIKD